MRTFLSGIAAAVLLMTVSPASADTVQAICAQAQPVWRETIEAFGREIVIDVQPQTPDAESVGIYRVCTISERERLGESPSRVQRPKQRGYANRSLPDEEVAIDEIDPAYRAYGSSVTAGEALDRVSTFVDGVAAQMEGVELELTSMRVKSPVYRYNKETGEWCEQVYADEVGEYAFYCRFMLGGVEIPAGISAWRDHRNWSFGMPEPKPAYWMSTLMIGENGMFEMKQIEAPSVICTTEESVDLAPLEKTKESLRGLVRKGLLRSVRSMELVYASFDLGTETEEWELRPVWVTEAEIYYDEKDSAEDYGEPLYDTVMTDARTGEIIELRWADGAQPK